MKYLDSFELFERTNLLFENFYDYIIKKRYDEVSFFNDERTELENIGFYKDKNNTYIYNVESSNIIKNIIINKRARQLPGLEGFISIYRIEINYIKNKKIKYFETFYNAIDYINDNIPDIDQDIKKYNM